jgi:rhodanese-related sulfurtransferase
MLNKKWPGVFTVILLLIVLAVMPILTGCGGGEESTTGTTTPTTTTETEEVEEFGVVRDAVDAYLADRAANMKASDLNLAIAEGDAPYIVSLRSADDYAKGHIPGAVNKKFTELTTLPEDEDILVYCYTGQTGSFAAAVLGVLGYDVQNLLHGMSSWSADPDIYVSRFDSISHQVDYAVETTADTASMKYDYPELDNTTSSSESAIIEAAAETVSPKYITAADLKMKIAEGEDMTIISVRSAADYASGHIPGAINLSLTDLADNLDQIDPDSPVYVYCYTGHSSAQAVALLQMLGYDAYSLKFGMCSWSSDPVVNAGKCFDASTVQGYKVES